MSKDTDKCQLVYVLPGVIESGPGTGFICEYILTHVGGLEARMELPINPPKRAQLAPEKARTSYGRMNSAKRTRLNKSLLTILVLTVFSALPGCRDVEQPLEPVNEPQLTRADHAEGADCLACHPGYGSVTRADGTAKPGGGPVLAPKTTHEQYGCWDCHNPYQPTGNLASIHIRTVFRFT